MPSPTSLIGDVAARSLLSSAELERADRFVREQDARLFRSSRALLRLVLASRLGRAPRALEIRRASCRRCGAAHGKPYVAGPLRFSFSQTSELSGVAISHVEVGFDVEAAIDDHAAREIEFALAADERAALRTAPDFGSGVTTVWVRKEAVVKCTGEGLNADLREFSVVGATAVLSGVRVWIADLPAMPGAAAAVATKAGRPRLTISTLEPDEVSLMRMRTTDRAGRFGTQS